MKLTGPASRLFETQGRCRRPGNLSWRSAAEVLVMRKQHVAYLALGVALLTGVLVAFRGLKRPNWDGHPLVGLWIGEPPPVGIISPHSLTLNSDGTGRESSGVGNFDCRWEPIEAAGAVVRLRIAHTGQSYWAGESRIEERGFVDTDTHGDRGRT